MWRRDREGAWVEDVLSYKFVQAGRLAVSAVNPTVQFVHFPINKLSRIMCAL